jgi:hypothetical protein
MRRADGESRSAFASFSMAERLAASALRIQNHEKRLGNNQKDFA